MKKLFTLLITAGILCGLDTQAQDIDSVTLSKLKLNFVVPDMPAFNVLGTEPSNILRPSTPKEFAVSFSEFYQDRKFLLPKAFALEISPAMLLNAKKGPVQLRQYIKNRVTNSLRISLGTSTDTTLSTSGRSTALGARISLIDKSDYITDMLEEIAGRLRIFRKEVSGTFMPAFAARNGIDTTAVDWELKLRARQDLMDKFNKELDDEAKNAAQKSFLRDIKSIKEKYKRDHWNDDKLDIAVALLASSPDSLIRNLRFNRASFWLTYAVRVGKSSQLLLGVAAQTARDLTDTNKVTMNKSYTNLSLPVRFLLGTNRVKGFAEAQYSYVDKEKANKVLINLGSEINVVDGFWFTFYGGMDYNSKLGKASFVTSLNLKVTLPENFNLF